MTKKLKLGVILIQSHPYSEIVQTSQHIEDSGWDSIWVADEFEIVFECWTLLAGLAEVTSNIRLGSLISAIMVRHPAILAKSASTVDHISNGRLELGIGSGVPAYMDPIYHMTGIKEWNAFERVKRFREQTEILDLILRKEEVSYSGEYYQLDGCKLTPRPVQQPRPPITIAALKPKMMRIAAEYADRWNTHADNDMTYKEAVTSLEKRIHLFDELCDEVGRKPNGIIKSILTYGQWEKVPHSSCDAFEDITNRFRDIGADELIIYYPFWSDEGKKVLEEISTNVLPDIR